MMRPQPRFFMCGTAARMPWKADDRLMAMMASHFSIGNSSIGETNWMPALLTRMSTLPNVLSPGAVTRGACALDVGGRAHAVDHDVGAGACEGACDRKPDAAGRAGHHRRLACQRTH